MSENNLRAFREYVGEHEAVRTRTIAMLTEEGDLGGVAELASSHGFEVSEDDLEDFLIDPGDELFDWEEELAVEAAAVGGAKMQIPRRRWELRRRTIPTQATTCDYSSDLRLKRDIERVGTSPSGIPRYTFAYLDDDTPGRFHGAMAQDLVGDHPQAVVTDERGFYKVKYDLIDVDFYAV